MRSDAQRNHDLLVAAAREVFAERGVEASLEEIARRAGLGIGTLYRHFATREALIEALVDQRIGEVVAIGEQAAADPDPWHGFVFLLERMLELQAGDRVLKEVLMEYAKGTPRAAAVREQLRALFSATLDRAHAQGTLRADFSLDDLRMLFQSFGPLFDDGVEPDAWHRQLRWLLDGLRARGVGSKSTPREGIS